MAESIELGAHVAKFTVYGVDHLDELVVSKWACGSCGDGDVQMPPIREGHAIFVDPSQLVDLS